MEWVKAPARSHVTAILAGLGAPSRALGSSGAQQTFTSFCRSRCKSGSLASQPRTSSGIVNPYTLQVLDKIYKVDASAARSKAFEDVEDINFDFVITVCDEARETCPVWPGQPIIAHWGVADPAFARGTDEEIFEQFKLVALQIQRRIQLLCALPFDKIDRLRLRQLTREIGTTD